MTPRERLLAALEGRSTDHVPVWMLFPYHPTGYYADVRNHPLYRPLHELALRRCVTLNRRNPRDIPFIRGGDVPLRQLADGREKLETDEDLEAFCRLPIETDEAALRPACDRFAARCRAERAEFPARAGAMMLDLGEPIGRLYQSARLESLAVWSLTHAAVIEDYLDRAMRHLRLLYRYALEHDLADVYFFVGSELAAPPLVGPVTFERWIVPHARELIALVRAYGKKSIQHFHGQIRAVLPGFRAMGADALHTIEAPPVGDCTLAQAYAELGDGITLIGNIQYDDFRALDEAAMRRAVRGVLDECAGRRLILSPTAGPYDHEPSAAFVRNVRAFVDEAWRHGPWTVGPRDARLQPPETAALPKPALALNGAIEDTVPSFRDRRRPE